MLRYHNFHFLYPLFYIIFVNYLTKIKPCPNNSLMIKYRKYHNIFLSVLSLYMLIGIIYEGYISNKYNSLYSLCCTKFNENKNINFFVKLFLYSKYLEWGDTLFIHLSNKPITNLQYTHHLTTGFLVYCNFIDFINPNLYVPYSLNCLVHVFMYWYFAFPKGFLGKYKSFITKSQILQHIIVLFSIIYSQLNKNCNVNNIGNIVGFILYSMYLIYFILFYSKNYIKNKI